MPLLVPCDELQPGMKLFEPLISAGRVMLKEGKALTQTGIDVMRRTPHGLNVRIADPVLDEAVEFEDDSRERRAADRARQIISEPISRIRKRFTRGNPRRFALDGAEVNALHTSLKELTRLLRESPTSAALITSSAESDTYLSSHTGNVVYLSLLLGSRTLTYVAAERQRQTSARGLDGSLARDLVPLGLGAMTMDLGMLHLQDFFKRDEALSEADRKAIRAHPSAGATMLPESFASVARMIVRTHHENFDGSGYPDALEGEKLHVFTRIVRIADAYDAATTKCVYKRAKSSARVLWEMLVGQYKGFYDPKLMTQFAGLIQPFPIGARLCLEDGRYGVVVKSNRKNPFKPKVVIAFDANNKPIPREELSEPVEVGSHHDLRVKSFQGEDLSFMYKIEPETGPSTRTKLATLLEAAYP